ncbi:MAG: RagB/SusD family nutrient uptake outer membrane protein [Candidatus Cryptobacteroides sp.]
MKIKNILLGLSLAGGLAFTACSGLLEEDRNPNSLSPSVFWKSEGDIMKGLTAAYAALQPNQDWAEPFERYFVIDSYRSDDCDYRADVSTWTNLASFTNDQTSSLTRAEWNYLFKGINYANQCIDNIPNVPDEDGSLEQIKTQSLAEARFLRAFYYYRLFLNFGEKLPLHLHQATEEDFFPPQAAAGEIEAFIKKELSEIQEDLPESYSAEWGGRATRYAAAAILGKFYMFCHELDKAEAEFKKIIDSGLYDLMDEYGDNFNNHKNNKESIFEIQFSGNLEGDNYEVNLWNVHLMSFDAYGYEEAYPSEWLFNTLKEDKTVDGKYSERLLKTIIFDDPDCRPWYYDAWSAEVGTTADFAGWHSEGTYYWHKFVYWDESLGADPFWECGINLPVVRYADVLLLYAECLNDRGKSDDAVDYINIVRDRVNVPQLSHGMTKEAVLKHLQDVERPCELALEGVRWYDLVRWGITKQALKDHNKPDVENFVEGKHELLPIPHQEFLLNSEWEQNNGFGK